MADAVPPQFDYDWTGPRGKALVKAWTDGRTDVGWGLMGPPKKINGKEIRDENGAVIRDEGFMPRYMRGEFNERRVIHGYDRGRWTFAFVMRSMRLVCIDIDGKNGGFDGAKRLGMLPPTCAEISKSGNGYHLFYLVDEEWDAVKGFGLLSDRIGIEQGVDIRATGCVYHHPQQRWNRRDVAPLPHHIQELLLHRDQKVAATTERIVKILEGSDDMEILMMQDEFESELAKPIPAGKRNNTLFAIGSKMCQAQVPNWEDKLVVRACDVGLDTDEIEKLVANIARYGMTVTAGAP